MHLDIQLPEELTEEAACQLHYVFQKIADRIWVEHIDPALAAIERQMKLGLPDPRDFEDDIPF